MKMKKYFSLNKNKKPHRETERVKRDRERKKVNFLFSLNDRMIEIVESVSRVSRVLV